MKQHWSELCDMVRDTGDAIRVLGIRRKHPQVDVVIINYADAPEWMQEMFAHEIDGPSVRSLDALMPAEAAELCGVTPNAIRQRMWRARNGNGSNPRTLAEIEEDRFARVAANGVED